MNKTEECYFKIHDTVISTNKNFHKKDRNKERIGVWCAASDSPKLCHKENYKCLIDAECWNIPKD